MAQDGGGWPGAAEQFWRPSLGDAEHGSESKRHLRVHYLAAEPLANSTAAEKRQRSGLTTATDSGAARVGAAAGAAQLARVWVEGSARLGWRL
jgi:hypothetical protein